MLNRNTIYKFISKNNKLNDMKYQPISCSIYDQIESFVVSKKKVKIVYTDNDSEEEIIHGVIENVYSENKAEYLTIMNTNIRLDFILTITEIKDK